MFQRTWNVIGWGPHLRRSGTYIQSLRTTAFRQEWAERVGLGFELVHIGPQNTASAESERVA
jgi:hypothetical protein